MSQPPSAPVEAEAREADAPALDDKTRLESRAVSTALTAADIDAIPPGARIGRYMVVDIIGSGGVGIVYSAYDPDLDRKVALKLLRRSKLTGALDAVRSRRGRLRREALALARLSHPNVVPVYEVAAFDDQIYVAMEFVEGSTLGEWLAQRERSWAEIVAVFVQAGRGLAAAHAADIVHRDFKPDNVRVGTDGRVRVLDFGLAGPLREGEAEAAGGKPDRSSPARPRFDSGDSQDSGELEISSELSGEVAVTREGQVMGTPAYMAPEQAAGGLVDARSDQFSFCVALYEAIYKARPFRGRHDDPRRYRELSRARSLPGYRPADLPNEIERAILRGLSLDPDKRFASVDALLTELTAVAEGPRRLWWVPASLVGLALVAVVAFYERDAAPTLACDDGQGMLAGVWDEAVAAELRGAVLDSNKPYADETWASVERALDGWSERWRRARLRACAAAPVEAERPSDSLERRIACLDRQLVRVESMISALRRLEQRPVELLDRLTPLLGRVPSPELCAAANVFEREGLSPRDGEAAGEAAQIREQLAAIEGLTIVGEFEPAIERGREALARARALEFEPVTAEALLTLGLALDAHNTDVAATAELLEEAAWTAARAGHDRALVRAAAAMAGNLGADQAKLELAEVWTKLAEAGFARLGDEPEIEIELRVNLGALAKQRGDFQAALVEFGRARELARERGEADPQHLRAVLEIGDALRELGRFDEAAPLLDGARLVAATELGAEHPIIPDLYDALGNVETSRGRFAEALALHQKALDICVEIYGEQHREVARTLNNMAIIFDEIGRYREAAQTLERARAVLAELDGPAHPDVAFVDVNLGSALHNLDRHGEAIERYEAALRVLEASLGPDHMAVGVTLQNLGSARAALGEHEHALRDYDRSARVLEQAFGAQHPAVAAVEFGRGQAFAALGRHVEARASYAEALATREAVYGAEHPELVEILANAAETELALAELDRARELGERALSLADDSNSPIERAEAQLVAARILVADPDADETARARARELARAAWRLLETAEAGDALRREIAAWLRAQGDGVDLGAGSG